MNEPRVWSRCSPADLSVELPEVERTDVAPVVERSMRAYRSWRELSFAEREGYLRIAQDRLREKHEELAALIALEVGKPLREARIEVAGVVAKFDLTIEDGEIYLDEVPVVGGMHPAMVRRRPRGPAAVISPFNFPIFLGHGSAVAYLLAGNTVIYKPSPMAGLTGAAYAREMMAALPEGVFLLVQGGSETGRELCVHPDVRSVCFTGSAEAGGMIARELAADFSKSLALELGGKNSAVVLADADLDLAAAAIADGICLTAGQRCNATSRILAHKSIVGPLAWKVKENLERFEPGDPRLEATMLGPLVNEQAVRRFQESLTIAEGESILRGEACAEVGGLRGHYVRPGLIRIQEPGPLANLEVFAPFSTVVAFDSDAEGWEMHDVARYGLTASIFTSNEGRFYEFGNALEVGNLYWNLPTTFSPSTLPFGGVRGSGNGKPGGRGFVRFAADEQAVQWRHLR